MPFPPFANPLRPVALVLLILGFFSWPVERADAQKRLLQENYGKDGLLRIEVESVFAGAAARGFMPVRVKLRNLKKADRTWTVKFNFGGGWNEMAFSSSFRVSAEAGTEPVHELMVPVPTSMHTGSSMYHTLNIEVTGGGLPAASSTDSNYYSTGWPAIGLSKKLADRNANRLNTEIQKRSGSGHSDVFGAQFDPELLPADWRGYTAMDVLMMTDQEWRGISPGARLAIVEWVRLGGRLDLYSTGDSASVLKALDFPGTTSSGGKLSMSFGEVRGWKWNGQDLEPSAILGRYRKVENRGEHLADDYQNKKSWGLYEQFGEKDFNPWLVILLLIVFGIVVGPINLFVWAKPGKRHRLFVTTPLISVVASCLILLLILFNDGIGGSGLRVILANLQSETQEKRLYVTQEQISRSGVLLGTGFKIEEPVFLSPIMIPPSEWNRIGVSNGQVTKFSLNDRTFRGDWFQSRSEQGQFSQSVRPTRSRIELTAAASADSESPPRLFSSLEFSIDEFFYRDENGKIWKAAGSGKIAGGEEIVLAPSDADQLKEWWDAHLAGMSAPMRGQAGKLWQRPGHFFATSTDRNAGFVDTLRSIDWKDDKALVFGTVLKATGAGTPTAEGDDADEEAGQ